MGAVLQAMWCRDHAEGTATELLDLTAQFVQLDPASRAEPDATRASAQAFGPGSSAFDSVDQVCEMLRAIAPSSLVVKGSRFMRMERIVRAYLDLNGVIPGEVVSHAV